MGFPPADSMETALLNYFVRDTQLQSTCDFNGYALEKGLIIYEVLRVEQAIPVFLKEHIRRFFSSAKLEHVKLDITPSFIRQAIRLLIAENRMQQGNIKFLYHRNGSEEGRFMAWVMPFFYPSPQHYREGVKVLSMSGERHNPNAKKALHDLRQKADHFIREKKVWEAVYVNGQQHITEGSRSNIFFVEGKKIVTPELSLVLPGITRGKVIQLAVANGFPVEETKIRIGDIAWFDACFLTGTSPKVLPVAAFDARSFQVDNPVVRLLMQAYDELVDSEVRAFRW